MWKRLLLVNRLARTVTPLHKVPYNEQLVKKEKVMRRVLKKIYNIIKHNRKSSTEFLDNQAELNSGQICEFQEVKPSPVTEGYRNKHAILIGFDVNKNIIAGYPLQKQNDDQIHVKADKLCIISDHHKYINQLLEEFIKRPPLPAEEYNGLWRSGSVRTTTTGETMLTLTVNPYLLSQEDLEMAKKSYIEYFTDGNGAQANIHSLYMELCSSRIPRHANSQLLHLSGQKYITEKLNDKEFRITPYSFFQVNTHCAEVLYNNISDLININSGTTHLLDMCCGTGTIGILLSNYVDQVCGIEVSKEAIECAKENALLNDVKNIKFVCGTAEDVLNQLILEDSPVLKADNLVVVLNPGRLGFKSKFIRRLRRISAINHFIFVTCKPSGVIIQNLVQLMMDDTKGNLGEPFSPQTSVAVDLFPHTKHCELIISMTR
ncbi:hypothetical protein LOTGIDRAFT_154241 [Lottia gigantea]|uniref:tRNA (uracil(54)-C(5))-methyltransferase n=1 Tax=Lottia gigantea TaxID=225164 RepID=V4A790_LOTGI|nr:hypothetical protein LOTGIDRAFT_154241 [Lottia gigantea]ESO89156.1 hypothetical protein LOTGIDRAFT_154241 [Lottia gigantea]